MNIKEKAIQFVLSTYLSDWNAELSLDKVLTAIDNEDFNNAVPWEPFENMEPDELSRNICDSIDYFISLFEELKA